MFRGSVHKHHVFTHPGELVEAETSNIYPASTCKNDDFGEIIILGILAHAYNHSHTQISV